MAPGGMPRKPLEKIFALTHKGLSSVAGEDSPSAGTSNVSGTDSGTIEAANTNDSNNSKTEITVDNPKILVGSSNGVYYGHMNQKGVSDTIVKVPDRKTSIDSARNAAIKKRAELEKRLKDYYNK